MPITDETAEQLAREAMERASPSERPRPRMDMANADERMRVAEAMLGNSLDALERSLISTRQVMAFFMGEYAAIRAKGELPKQPPMSPEAAERINAVARPKTFLQHTTSQSAAEPEKDYGPTTTA